MNCTQTMQIISAYADGELELRERTQAEEHLRTCPKCAAALKGISTLKSAMDQDSLHHRAPAALHARILQLVDEAASEPVGTKTDGSRWSWRWAWLAGAVAAILVVGIGLAIYFMTPSEQKRVATEAVWNHKRSLQANHLVDFRSSDPKKVSEWLQAKLEFVPWVPEQTPKGDLLVGARVDVLDGRDVAALVYSNNDQMINLFEVPSLPKVAMVDLNYMNIYGTNVGHWNNSAWDFYIVSGGDELSIDPLTRMFVSQSCSTK
jgi:anti-sigma factor RsiW